MTVIDDPAEAVAISRCLGARTIAQPGRPAERPSHPRPCGWCDWPLADLRRMLDGFNSWAEYNARSNTFGHHELRVWSELPRAEQERRIVVAQAFPEKAAAPVEHPVAALAPPPAHDADEEGPAWLR